MKKQEAPPASAMSGKGFPRVRPCPWSIENFNGRVSLDFGQATILHPYIGPGPRVVYEPAASLNKEGGEVQGHKKGDTHTGTGNQGQRENLRQR